MADYWDDTKAVRSVRQRAGHWACPMVDWTVDWRADQMVDH